MLSVTGKEINFKMVERQFYELGCEIAKSMMKEFIEGIDKKLAQNRDKRKLRHKGKRIRTLKTLMGEVEIDRTIYQRINDKGQKEHIYLLDQELGFETIGTISPNLVEKILDQICEMPYREVSNCITELTNQRISHQGVWNLVQQVGRKQTEKERKLINDYKNNKLTGEKEVKILFEEADGVYLSMQGKSRGKRKGKKELKIGISYEGWIKRYPGSREYKTIEKIAYAGYLTPSKFSDLREAYINKKYNTDEIEYRILNGDGASWIENGFNSENSVFQLDSYHLSQSIVKAVRNKKVRIEIYKWLKQGEFEKIQEKLEALKYECGGLVSEIEKISRLQTYLRTQEKGLINYKNREDIKIPEPPQGMEYRNLGTMESTVNAFSSRMKGRKSWSENGATNLAKIIALKLSGDFQTKINGLISSKLSERLQERFEEQIINTRDYLKKPKKSNIYPTHKGSIPFITSSRTNGREAIKNMFNYKNFTELTYR